MNRTRIGAVTPGARYRISGFVENLRNKKKMAFLVIRDISGKLQVTVEKEKNAELAALVDQLTLDSVVTVEGEVVANEYVKMGGMEMLPDTLRIESVAEALPIQDDSDIDARMDYRWIDLRREQNQLMLRLQTTLTAALRVVLDLYKQMAMASGLERIFETGPVFRAEKSYTNKHATEFSGFDLEFSYVYTCEEVMHMEEELLAYAFAKVKAAHGEDIVRLFGEDKAVTVPTVPFPRITLAELYRELESRYGYTVPDEAKGDLTTEAEHLCARFSMEKYGSEFLFVTDYSAAERAFYHMRDERGVPMGYDLIWRGCEITTGAIREHRYDVLKKQADEKGLGEDVAFYLQFFRYGCPPHGGFGLGLDRLTMLFLGLSIKEVQFLFRGPNRLTP